MNFGNADQRMMNSPSSSRYRRYSSPDDVDSRKRRHSSDSKVKELKGIRITVINRNKTGAAKFSILCSRQNEPHFQGADENYLPSYSEQRKIQIEIKRCIPERLISDSPVRRSIRNPDSFHMPRKKTEGQIPLLNHIERVIELIEDSSDDAADYKPEQKRERIQDRLGNSSKPWNPEDVPRNSYFFEHDNREENDDDGRQMPPNNYRGKYHGFRSRGRGIRGRGIRGRGGLGRRGKFTSFPKNPRGYYAANQNRSPARKDSNQMWKHDKFHELQNDY